MNPSVVIGVCGIGFGHAVRQQLVGSALKSRGWDVSYAAYGNAISYLEKYAPELETHDVWVPILRGSAQGLNVWSGMLSNVPALPKGIWRHLGLRRKLKRRVPDCFITDYEPNVVRFAKYFRKPVISIDQQSKYRYLNFDSCNGKSRLTEHQRMELFLPGLTHSFATSFFKISETHPSLTITSPILPEFPQSSSDSTGSVLVYFSDYLGAGQHTEADKFVSIMRSLPQYHFRLYTTQRCLKYYNREELPPNVKLFDFRRPAFLRDLQSCQGVISNAGHNLISEALAVKTPLLLCPLETFDQHFCAQTVDRLGVGMSTQEFTSSVVRNFIERTDSYRQEISRSKALNFDTDPIDMIEKFLLNKIEENRS